MTETEVIAQPHCSIVVPHQSRPAGSSVERAYSWLPQRGSFWAKKGAPFLSTSPKRGRPPSVGPTTVALAMGCDWAAFAFFWSCFALALASSQRWTPAYGSSALAVFVPLPSVMMSTAARVASSTTTATAYIMGSLNRSSGGLVAS